MQNARWREPPVNESLPVVLRDIFAPLKSPKKVKSRPTAPLKSRKKARRRPTEQKPSRPPPSLKLRGTIVGGQRPIAIINDQFVRIGDWIGEYRVVRIGKTEVLLNSGDRKIELEMVKKIE
jgi:IS30 family transposase